MHVRSHLAGVTYPRDECRQTRLSNASMDAKMLAVACSRVAESAPWTNSFFRLAE